MNSSVFCSCTASMYVCGFVRKMVLMLGWGLSMLCWPAQLAVACTGRSTAGVLVKEVGQAHGGHQGGGQAEAVKKLILDNIARAKGILLHLCRSKFYKGATSQSFKVVQIYYDEDVRWCWDNPQIYSQSPCNWLSSSHIDLEKFDKFEMLKRY